MNKKPSQLRAYFSLTYYALKAQAKNPATFAFGFIFPIVFISIFGLIGGSTATITLGIPTHSDKNNVVIQAIKEQKFIKTEEGEERTLKEKLVRGKLAGILTITPQGENSFTAHLVTSSANPQEAGTVTSLVQGITDKTNLTLSGISTPPITLKKEAVSGRTFRYIDFALPGQIGFSLLSTAIFGTVFGLIYLKKALILKRMFATPTRAITILFSQGTSRLIIALIQTLLILAIGVLVFQFYLPHGFITFLELLILSSFGLIAFLGFGYFLAGLSNDENAAGPLVNLVTLPQFLLSGTFFPIESLPTWLQPIASNLPLSYFNQAIRTITTEGGSLPDTWPYLLGLLVWGIAMYIIAAKTFKWE